MENQPVKNKIELTVSVTGKIPRRSYENFSPFFSVTETLDNASLLTDEQRQSRQKEIFDQLTRHFNLIREEIVKEELQEEFESLSFIYNEKDGRRYPRVTDILYWDNDTFISSEDLNQYGILGSAIHTMIDHWIETKKWDRTVIPNRDKAILQKGNLKLWDTLDEINFLGFMKEHGKDIVFKDGEFRAFSEKHFYCGQPDRVGTYKKIPSIFDFKCRAAKDDDFKQASAYCKLEDKRLKGIKQMVIIPLNSQNKSGYGRPVISDEIDRYFDAFMEDRKDFKERFGI